MSRVSTNACATFEKFCGKLPQSLKMLRDEKPVQQTVCIWLKIKLTVIEVRCNHERVAWYPLFAHA